MAVIWLAKPDGSGWLNGGLERWCRDAALLVASHGYHVTIYQKALRTFQLSLSESVTVKGLVASLRFSGNVAFYRALQDEVEGEDPICFVSQELAMGSHFKRAVAINHGVWWDGDFAWWKRWLNKRLQASLLSRMRAVICVDTNYINWCHAEIPRRKSWDYKLRYVPNYADASLFPPILGNLKRNDEIRILFARRVSDAVDRETLIRQGRGAGLLLRAAEILEKRGVNFTLLFAGRNSSDGPIARFAAEKGWQSRIETFEVSLDEMPQIYARADVAVVPSLEHEGTSLAALESIVSGLPTVVSHIGGLGNIAISGLNAEVADLTPISLADAIQRSVAQRPLEQTGILDACRSSLGKDRWNRQIWAHFNEYLGL